MHHELDDALASVRNPVGQGLAEDLTCRSLVRRQANPPPHLVGPAPPRRVPERQAEHLLAGVPTRLDRQHVDVANVALRIQDAGEDPGLVEDRFELCVCGGQRLLGLPARRDVADDLGRAGDPARGVSDRRDREGDLERTAVLGEPDRLVVLDVIALLQPGQDLVFFGLALVRDEQPDVPADHLLGRVAEDPLGACVPGSNRPVQRLAQDRVRGRVHDRREMGDSRLLERGVADVGHGGNSRSAARRALAVLVRGSTRPAARSARLRSTLT